MTDLRTPSILTPIIDNKHPKKDKNVSTKEAASENTNAGDLALVEDNLD
jgi:hypothetical protein